MSLKDIRSECTDVAGLLQAYVDNELPDDEQEHVAGHLAACRGCRAAVSEQAWVRATLRSVEREPAPAALRMRIGAALDEIDAESTAAAAPPTWRRRIADFFRGGMMLVPATAAAVGLFAVVQYAGMPSAGPTAVTAPGAGLTPALHPPAHAEAADDDVAIALRRLEPQVGFALQVAPTRSADGGVELVSAQLDSSRQRPGQNPGARLEYRVLAGGRPTGVTLEDHQMPAQGSRLTGPAHRLGGRDYHLERDAAGEALVRFIVGDVAHTVRLSGGLDPGTALVDDAGEAVPADYAPLLRFAGDLPAAGAR
jgi:anti-sigma factor (TIGR02949 family)